MESTPQPSPTPAPDVEVAPSGKRVFSLAYKRRILDQLDACSHIGEKSALIRREGLYSCYISKWRKQVAKEEKTTKKRRGRPRLSATERETRELRAENERLKKELKRSKLAIDVQKKLLELLENISQDTNSEDSNSTPSSSS